MQFPWPDGSRVRVVIARNLRAEHRRSILLAAMDRSAQSAAQRARRRSPAVARCGGGHLDKAPVNAILAQAKQFTADVIVLGWRGHGGVRRLLMGSVSRAVVRGAKSAVLVVRRAKRVSRIVVGCDESATAKRAVAFIDKLAPPPSGRVTLVNAVQLMAAPSLARVPGAATIAREIRRTNTMRRRAAMRELSRAAKQLKRSGWHTRTMLTTGEPLRDLLRAVSHDPRATTGRRCKRHRRRPPSASGKRRGGMRSTVLRCLFCWSAERRPVAGATHGQPPVFHCDSHDLFVR